MDYRELTTEKKREIVLGNLEQLESEHYALALRLKAYDGATDVTEDRKDEMIRQTRDHLDSLEAAIAAYRDELDQLG